MMKNNGHFGAYDSILSKYVSSTYNEQFMLGTAETKFGDIVIESYNETTDTARVTVEISDYTKKFVFQGRVE